MVSLGIEFEFIYLVVKWEVCDVDIIIVLKDCGGKLCVFFIRG